MVNLEDQDRGLSVHACCTFKMNKEIQYHKCECENLIPFCKADIKNKKCYRVIFGVTEDLVKDNLNSYKTTIIPKKTFLGMTISKEREVKELLSKRFVKFDLNMCIYEYYESSVDKKCLECGRKSFDLKNSLLAGGPFKSRKFFLESVRMEKSEHMYSSEDLYYELSLNSLKLLGMLKIYGYEDIPQFKVSKSQFVKLSKLIEENGPISDLIEILGLC